MSLRALVCVKQVSMLTGPVLIGRDQRLAPASLTVAVNDNDLFALEEALRLRSERTVTEVIALTAASADTAGTVAWCYASGVDRVVSVGLPDAAAIDAFGVGRVIAAAGSRLGADLILCGQRSADSGNGLVPIAIAAALGTPYVSEVARLRVEGAALVVERKLERGARAVWRTSLPAVAACATGINVPRYVPIAKQIIARRAKAEELTCAALGIDLGSLVPRLGVRALMPARIRPKRTATSTLGMNTADKMRLIMSGGVSEKQEKKIVRGDPETLARELLAFLREHQFVTSAARSNGRADKS